jgi:beta-glucosidase/6-phospho-beta-glucosidase/beta-galactosidase
MKTNGTKPPRPPRQVLFPGFFLGGFECASHIDRSGRRQDYAVLTDHERQVREDYERAASVGIRVVREGLRWHLIDRAGRYDFSSIARMKDAAKEVGLTQINCLFHYGWPDDLDPLTPAFVKRFGKFAAAFAEWRVERDPAPRWYGPINEGSMLAHAAGEAGWFEPFLEGKGDALKRNLVRAAIEATDVIRSIDPDARFLSIDPVAYVVPPANQPERADEAAQENEEQYELWDMLCGREEPRLGGAPGYLDVIGVNCYPDTQHELGSDVELPLDDPRRKPFSEMLCEVYARYGRPILVAETSARNHQRSHWIRDITQECLRAIEHGVDVQGICLYPLVDMPEWKFGEIGPLGKLGLWDVVKEGDGWKRVINKAYLEALQDAQKLVERSKILQPEGVYALTGARVRQEAAVAA